MLVTYAGPDSERKLWGTVFPKGEAVEVSDPALLSKCGALGCFELSTGPSVLAQKAEEQKPKKKRGRPRKNPMPVAETMDTAEE